LTREINPRYKNDRIDENFIKANISDFTKHFYVCGPDAMVTELVDIIQNAGASIDALVFEN